MQKQFSFLDAIDRTKEIINDVTFMCDSRQKSTYFTRKGNNKLTFQSTILFHFFFVKRTLQLEIDQFFKAFDHDLPSISKQGYTAARRKLSPYAFSHIFHSVAESYYEEGVYQTFHGYRLCAIDGSIVKLNDTKALTDYFGSATNQKVHRTRAKASTIYDVENNLFLTGKLAPYATSERDLAKELINGLPSYKGIQNLFLFDRGYPSREFLDYLERAETHYLIRCSKSVMKEVKNTTKADQIIQVTYKESVWNARVIRLRLDSDQEEILLTNLMDEDFTIDTFKKLYFKRWGIEVKYGVLKNKIKMENFTGSTPLTVQQDFFASLYLINMASLLHHEATEYIEQADHGKELKYRYQASMNRIIGGLKEYLIAFFSTEDKRIQRQLYRDLIKEVKRDKTPIRPNRANPRNRALRSNAFALNQKGCL